MADSIKISTQVLTDTAQKVRNCNTAMDEKLADINKNMNDLEATWKSDAASDIRAAMNALKPKFEQYKNVIESYAKFLASRCCMSPNTSIALSRRCERMRYCANRREFSSCTSLSDGVCMHR